MSSFLELARPHCSAEMFDDEIIAINLDTGIYFSMKNTANLIFTDLCNGHPTESILAAAPAGSRLYLSIEKFIQELLLNGLLRPTITPTEIFSKPLFQATSPELTESPILETYADMQNLLLLDPVHEVDKIGGWPIISDDEIK